MNKEITKEEMIEKIYEDFNGKFIRSNKENKYDSYPYNVEDIVYDSFKEFIDENIEYIYYLVK